MKNKIAFRKTKFFSPISLPIFMVILLSLFSFNLVKKNNLVKNNTADSPFVLTISNLASGTAKIHIGIYKIGDHFPEVGKASFIKVISPTSEGSFSISLPDIPYGTYALAMYQDLNGDEKLNKNFIGYPKEPFGFSKNFKPKFSAPTFDDCSIVFDATHTNFTISLIR